MLTYRPVNAEQYDEFLQLLRVEAADYLDRTMELMQMSWEEFAQLVRTVGQVYGIYYDDHLAGFYWIEERCKILHLHGIVVRSSYRGKGIGTTVLKMLASKYSASTEAIELGVHDSNTGAITLYEKLGYATVKRLDDLGFRIMQKPLSQKHPGPGT